MSNFTSLFSEEGAVRELLARALGALHLFRFSDFLDILLVTVLLYQLIKLMRDTRAVQLAKGILLIAVVYGLTLILKMTASGFFFGRLWDSAIIVIFLIFQPEIRHAVESMGRSRSWLSQIFSGRGTDEKRQSAIRQVAIASAKAAAVMSANKIGALIVFERSTLLGDVAKTGTILEARVSASLLQNVFFPKAPLHDGAVLIRGESLYAAGCVLPLTENAYLPSSFGMRHRAALGISEQSDAVVLVVSEESGKISMASEGVMRSDLTEAESREALIAALSRGLSEKGGKETEAQSKRI